MTIPFFVFLKNGSTFSCTQPECMDSEITITVQSISFSKEQAQAVLLIVFGLSEDQMAKYLGGDKNNIKRITEKLRTKMDVEKCKQLSYRALQLGFEHTGTVNGQPVFTGRERRVLQNIAPWVTITKVTES